MRLIPSAQITRGEALERMAMQEFTPEIIRDDRDDIFRKIFRERKVSEEEFEERLRVPKHLHAEYPTNHRVS